MIKFKQEIKTYEKFLLEESPSIDEQLEWVDSLLDMIETRTINKYKVAEKKSE